MDNSPIFDGVPFDAETHLLAASDVGLVSLYVTDCAALACLARLLGRESEAAELETRRAGYADRLQELWHAADGIFANRRTDTGEFCPRRSPMCFYPMLAGVATEAQTGEMIERHLCNEREFWGEWVLPASPRSDPAFGDQHYWRGRVWAPLNFLVYLGLRRAGRREVARELAVRSLRLFERNWREGHGLFENFSALTGRGGEVALCDPMYPWTGLLVFMNLIEGGQVPLPSLLRPMAETPVAGHVASDLLSA
jgi:glycogen debranching enzyme